MEKRSLRK